MKQIFKKLSITLALSLCLINFVSLTAFASTNESQSLYEINLDGMSIEMQEGQEITVPMVMEEYNPLSRATFVGDKGTLTLTVSGGRIYYSISLIVAATSFSGYMNITDISSGFSGGMPSVSGFSGSVATSNLKGHLYQASLTGTAYLGATPVAHTVPNLIKWQN